jgi:uncharacterized protein (TIGR03790 family)
MRNGIIILILLLFCRAPDVYSLEPNEILIIANGDVAQSVQLAKYYCSQRLVPKKNILALALGRSLDNEISRDDYNKKIAEPIRKKLLDPEFFKIRCLLTTYGVPIKVGGRGILKGYEKELKLLKQQLDEQKKLLDKNRQDALEISKEQRQQIELQIILTQSHIDQIEGRETGASVDSELAMVLSGDYELYRWQGNELASRLLAANSRMLMVSRLDGPGFEIAKGLIDKAIKAEKKGLAGTAYIDCRFSEVGKNKPDSLYEKYDRSLSELAQMLREKSNLAVVEEKTPALFGPNKCPDTAIYFGWYSLQKYVDSFQFVDGAIGFHIASLEAVNLRDASSSQWCPAMLTRGVTATIGAVAEPYLHAFPDPKSFVAYLLDGNCLAEAYAKTNPFNSWQMVLIGDPLYKPFKPSNKGD